jgi:hypothetical protein
VAVLGIKCTMEKKLTYRDCPTDKTEACNPDGSIVSKIKSFSFEVVLLYSGHRKCQTQALVWSRIPPQIRS